MSKTSPPAVARSAVIENSHSVFVETLAADTYIVGVNIPFESLELALERGRAGLASHIWWTKKRLAEWSVIESLRFQVSLQWTQFIRPKAKVTRSGNTFVYEFNVERQDITSAKAAMAMDRIRRHEQADIDHGDRNPTGGEEQ